MATDSPAPVEDLAWGDCPMSMVDILKDYILPVVIKMDVKGKLKDKQDSGSLIQQPLVLFREMKGFKVVAKNVSNLEAVPTLKGGVQYREAGSVLIMPVDYPGWFRLMDDTSVPILNVANLARVMPAIFMSAKRFPGFCVLDPFDKTDYMYEKLIFPAGVYRVISVFEDYVKYKNERAGTKKKLLRCLVCESADGIDILIPFDVTGEFYIVEHKKTISKAARGDNNARAYSLKQLVGLGAFIKPHVLKLLLGEHPNKPCGFTGIIKVVDIIEDWTVIACTLDGSRKMIEMPVAPYPQFLQAVNSQDLLEKGVFKAEYDYIKGGAADKYSMEMKVRERIPVQEKKKRNGANRAAMKEEEKEHFSELEAKLRQLKPLRRTGKNTFK